MPVAVSQWHWMDRGRRAGPVSWGELQTLARCGKLKPTDMVLRDGSSRWQQARTAREVEDGPDRTGASAAVLPPQTYSVPQGGFDTDGLAAAGFRPVRFLAGLGLIAGGIFATVAGHELAVARGGGTYILFTGPVIWGFVLALSSFGTKQSDQ